MQDAVARWIDDDPDPATRAELTGLPAAELADRFSAPLAFGTAGLRGPVRAGPNGMNVAVVTRTTAGVAAWLHDRCLGGSRIIVGRDARHGSAEFARAAAEVLAAAGFAVTLLPSALPTPVLAHACRATGAAAAVQITASHNPPADNGYKLYLDGGAQLVSPADREIEAAIARVGPARSIPRAPVEPSGAELVEQYLATVAALPRGTARDTRIALTPLHGVGGEIAVEALRRAGFTDVHVVEQQFTPDPAFPTVAFPNPEEPGATDLLLDLARSIGADVAIALDPDADRCAVGVPGPTGWRMLRGDEAGVLLGDDILSATSGDRLVATTIVSSSMLGRIAAPHGARYAETLTGFKWLVRAGQGLVFAYEEAIGLCVDPAHVRDKDGISATIAMCDLVARLKHDQRTLLDELDRLAAEHGVHVTDQVSRRFEDLDEITAAMQRLREALPTQLGGEPVTVEDLHAARGQRRTDAVILRTDHLRIVVRPSGTEPKLKCYLQAVADVVGGNLDAARARAEETLEHGRGFAREL
ncbi:phospho-sugar mutase [Lolliginicoccus suaedae]|uniref:phospho-sugar mutase n=1 Tax=Lolliginicoccus suaedae TaxID=2605429 RepID=UPI0011F01804|nr:phospho-sugar mutase [Lolliginicoccus suaedae]